MTRAKWRAACSLKLRAFCCCAMAIAVRKRILGRRRIRRIALEQNLAAASSPADVFTATT